MIKFVSCNARDILTVKVCLKLLTLFQNWLNLDHFQLNGKLGNSK